MATVNRILRKESLLCLKTISYIVFPSRCYRGRKTHAFGRSHGLVGSKTVKHPLKNDPLRDEVDNLIRMTSLGSYQDLDIKINGYDMVLVEEFSKFVHQLMIKYRQDVVEAYALPTYDTVIKHAGNNLPPKVEDMETDFVLSFHTRMIRVSKVPSPFCSVVLQILMDNVPQSVTFTVQEHSEDDEAKRFKRRSTVEAAQKVLRDLIKQR